MKLSCWTGWQAIADKEAPAAVAFSPDNYQYGTLFYSSFKMLLDSKVRPLHCTLAALTLAVAESLAVGGKAVGNWCRTRLLCSDTKVVAADQPIYILGSNMGNEAMYAAVGWGLKVVGYLSALIT